MTVCGLRTRITETSGSEILSSCTDVACVECAVDHASPLTVIGGEAGSRISHGRALNNHTFLAKLHPSWCINHTCMSIQVFNHTQLIFHTLSWRLVSALEISHQLAANKNYKMDLLLTCWWLISGAETSRQDNVCNITCCVWLKNIHLKSHFSFLAHQLSPYSYNLAMYVYLTYNFSTPSILPC